MKKIICTLLTAVLLLTSLFNTSLIALADDEEYLKFNEPYNFTLTASSTERKVIYYYCTESGYYDLTAIFHDDTFDCFGMSFQTDNSSGVNIFYNKRIYTDNVYHDFITFKMTKDKTYKFELYSYSKSGNADLILTYHEHSFEEVRKEPTCAKEGSTCQRCSKYNCPYIPPTIIIPKTDDHNFVYGICSRCGSRDKEYDFLKATLTLGEESSLTTTNSNEYAFFYFTPKEDGYYSFEITHTKTNASFNFFYGENRIYIYNGKRAFYLSANTEYEFRINSYMSSGDTFNVLVENHTHELNVSSSLAANCIREGNATYSCKYCDYKYTETYPKTTDKHKFVNGACILCKLEQEGYVKLVREMVDDEEYSLTTVYGGEKLYFTYKAKETDLYDIIATGRVIYALTLNVVGDDGKSYVLKTSNSTDTTECYSFNIKKDTVVNIEITGSVGGITYTVLIRPHTHSYKAVVTKPTCDSIGYTKHTCTNNACKHSYIDNKVPPTGKHSLTTTVIKPTCLTSGYTETMCRDCDYDYVYDYVAPNPEAHHFYADVCEYCGAKSSSFTSKELVLDTAENVATTSAKGSYVTFVPQESGYYIFQSYASKEIDSYCELYDEKFNFIDYGDDISSSNFNFKVTSFLTKGNTYYLYVDTFEGKACSVPVKVYKHTHTYVTKTKTATCGAKGYVKHECSCGSEYYESVTPATNQHNWKVKKTVNPNCIDEGYTLEQCSICKETRETNIQPKNDKHEYENGRCIHCDKIEPKGTTVQLGEMNKAGTVNCHFSEKNQVVSVKFVPSHDGYYLFKTNGYYDTYAELCDKVEYAFNTDDDSGLGDNCQIVELLSAGATYYIQLRVMDSETADVTLEICEHNHEFVQYKEPAGCNTEGKTTFTCSSCLYSYESEFVPPTYEHNYINGICIECGQFDESAELVELNQDGDTTAKNETILTFVPKYSCEYEIKSNSNFDVDVMLVDEFMQDLEIQSCNSEADFNFVINKKLCAGIRYYLVVGASMPDDFTITASVKHKYTERVTKPTCTNKGYTEKYCEICGDSHKYDYTEALGHKNTVVTTKATTSKNGSKVTKCSVCGDKISSKTIYYPKTITLSTAKYTYDGKVKKPSVKVVDSNGKIISTTNYTVTYPSGRKNVGKYTVKITFKGDYSGTVSKTFTIVPKATTISKLTATKGGFKVTLKKQATQTTGYQIQYSTSSKFTSPKTVTITKNTILTKAISKLAKGKKYYVRVRTYKTVNGTKYYSAWSVSKAVTTKR